MRPSARPFTKSWVMNRHTHTLANQYQARPQTMAPRGGMAAFQQGLEMTTSASKPTRVTRNTFTSVPSNGHVDATSRLNRNTD